MPLPRVPVLAVLCAAATACSAAPAERPVTADHTTAPAPAAQPADKGPEPGGLRVTGHVETEIPFPAFAWTTSHDVIDDQLFASTPKGLTVHDPVTGKERWHYREHDRLVDAYAVTGGVVFLATGPTRRNPPVTVPDHWTALDAGTGRKLWSRRGEGAPLKRSLSPRTGMAGVVPLRRNGELLGIDVRSGRPRWTVKGLGTAGCTFSSGLGDDKLMLTERVCTGGKTQYVALDPATGKERWRRPFTAGGLLNPRSQNGVTLIGDGDHLLLIDASGRVLAKERAADLCSDQCKMAVSDRYAVIVDGKGFHTVDLRSGARRTSRNDQLPEAPYFTVATAGGRFYGMRTQIGSGLFPAALGLIDPATGEASPMPVPFSLDFGEFPKPGRHSLHVAGGRAFVTQSYEEDGKKKLWTDALATIPGGSGPPELGGVPVKDWPNACTMVPGYEALRPLPLKEVRIGEVELKHTHCLLAPAKENPTAESTRLSILWVARTAEDAAEAFAPDPRYKVGDGAYEPELSPTKLVMRSGRYIIGLNGADPDDLALAGAVHRVLRDR
ncbi:PQQ-binding-like beta-propeller repeat protein [Spirillospora sp. CA-253888]